MVAFLLFTACLDPVQVDGSTDGGSDTDDSGSGGSGSDIYDVRAGQVGDGDTLTLTGVVVSSPPTREDSESGLSDGFFVQDPHGGANSGLYVWSAGGFGDELTVQVGDEVSISGQISEYYDWTELVIGDASSITITGGGTLPDPVDLADGTGVDWNEYESVPVKLTDQTITKIDAYSTGTLSAGVKLDDGFVYNDYGCRGHYDSVTGIVFYQYEAWSINNRTEDELSGYTAPEQIDATIRDVREGTVCGTVRLENVVAIAPGLGEDDGETTVFVQDAGGGEYSGMVVFMPSQYVAVNAGDLLTVIGEVSDYYGLAELYIPDAEGGFGVTSGGGEVVATELTEIPTDWEPYESGLITISNVSAVTDQEYGAVFTDWGVYVDNLFYDHDGDNGTTWSSVTGALYYTSYDDIPAWNLEPRDASDLSE